MTLIRCLALTFAFTLVPTARAEDPPAGRPPKLDRGSVAPQTFKGTNGQEISFGLFTPKDLKADEKLPLVLCLHGSGGSSEAGRLLVTPAAQEKHRCFVMIPKCDSKEALWAKINFERPEAKARKGKSPNRRAVEVELLEALDDVVANHPIDAQRIYITGQSMGGFGTWGLIALQPEKFAAAVPICGGWNPEEAAKIKGVPIWTFHGAKDPTVPVKSTQDMVAALKKAGAEPKYTEFPDVGHDSWVKAYATDELWDWMFKQRRGAK